MDASKNKDNTGSPMPLTEQEAQNLLKSLPGWQIQTREDITLLQRPYMFPDRDKAEQFADRVMSLAEDHHKPNRIVEDQSVTVEWWTVPFNGLHENDFVKARNTDLIYESEFQSSDENNEVDQEGKESFPASDPPANY